MEDAIGQLTQLVVGKAGVDTRARELLASLFGERYHKRHFSKTMVRDALRLSPGEADDHGVPFAGFINPENSEAGPYGGASLVWFPAKDHGSLVTYVVGTRGLSPDEGMLTRPGHRRRVAAFRRLLAGEGVECWSKPDPSNLGTPVPRSVAGRFSDFAGALSRYGHEVYCLAHVPEDMEFGLARRVVTRFLDLYSYERGWDALVAYRTERDGFLSHLRQDLFPEVDADLVYERLKARHFVVLQGPPGTGKTRLAEEVLRQHFGGRGTTIQFHPAVTYEDFVVGLAPDTTAKDALRFLVRPGWLVDACRQAADTPFLLVIDEINRADLGKILGEAIYLFEPGEVGKRTVTLAHAIDGSNSLSMPANLYVLGTMNTADRSIAHVDLAIRRRFTFITMMPDRTPVASQGLALATEFYDRICDVFVEHAPAEALELLPGHSYFLADSEAELKKRFRFELVPLLDDYLLEGYLGPATTELQAVRDALDDAVR
ncbi:MAG: AAA family ATPase [Dehalococcoidia bacterium]|jgi:5-methylcytosine-specific restriction protein B|nr:AAA family ATPase [Dehalococcoidia bacterium]